MPAPDTSAKRPLTADDLFRITLVSDPQATRDGTAIAWVETTLDKDSDSYRSAIWIARPDGSDARQLTAGSHRDSSPRWSPDGKTIAFLSNRPAVMPAAQSTEDGHDTADHDAEPDAPKHADRPGDAKPQTQLWTIRIDGGEADQLTNHPHGVAAPAWAPGGDALAFTAMDDVDEGDGFDAPVTSGGVADERIVRDIHFRADGQGFIERFTHIWQVEIANKTARRLTNGDVHDSAPEWSPDGASIAFVGNRSARRRKDWTCSAIYLLTIDDGSITALTPEDAYFSEPRWSPSGDRIAFLGHLDASQGGSKNANLWTVQSDGSELINHTGEWDISIGDFGMSDVHAASSGSLHWLDDSTMLALVSARGATQVFRMALDGEPGNHHQLTHGNHRVSGFAVVSDGLTLVRGAVDAPFELHACELDGSGVIQISHANDDFLREVALSPAIELDVTSADGQAVQAWLLPPFGFSRDTPAQHPLILQIHGGPHAMYGHAMFHEMQLMAARGYAVLFCNPRGSAGYGEHFTTCTRGRWGESDMPDVIAAVETATGLGWIDRDRLGITGGSYGGYLTNWIIGHDQRFKSAVTQRCVSNFHSFFGTSDIGSTFGRLEFDGVPWHDAAKLLHYSPISHVADMKTPLLIIHNELDFRCPIEQAEQMFTALKYLERDVGFVRIPGESHDLSRSGTPSRRLARLHHLIGWFDARI
ncbi:MAG: Acylamino-acid-releasing enzyme [uncultured Thermomicrobiales bacterium]|uniref:Acylamino-acid-releasing enzyme n=1 Tax=uncultured Thermomicrobiales bacterium TaxID=1645740 RepID=A0A6J4V3Q8_9BACT|nr:MAG: Acylamino-acid-releasing enzyme [uncultured Thermomicrobiales bacterium]